MNRSSRQLATFYLVMFALIFNAISSSAAYAESGSGKNGVLLCTSQGYQWVNVDSDSSSGEQAQQHCKLCLFPPSDDSFEPIIATCDSSLSFDDNGHQAKEQRHTIFKLRFARLTPQGRAPPL
jgi:hypothetical protein